jgi:hypothetical protein
MPIVALLAAFLAAWLCLPETTLAGPSGQRTVVIVLAPYLSWGDLTPTATPTLWKLAGESAIGAVNGRSRSRVRDSAKEAGSPLEGALSISAGSWAAQDPEAAAAYVVSERYEVGTAAEAFRRTTGEQVGTSRIVFLGMPVTQRLNAGTPFMAVPGLLGDAVERAGGITAAVGNSDVGYATGAQSRVRPAALVAMNGEGLVEYGDVSTDLLAQRPYAPFGIETDMGRFATQLDDIEEAVHKTAGPSLVVLDPGDLYRVARFRSQVTDDVYLQHKERALASLDSVVTLARERFGGATILVVGQSVADPELGEQEGLAPIIMSGTRTSGFLTSNSTQEEGLVTDLDITATTLDVLGIDRPVEVLGSPMTVESSALDARGRVDKLGVMNATAIAIDSVKPAVVNSFVSVTVLTLLLSAVVLMRAGTWRPAARRGAAKLVKALLLLVACVPVSGWLMFLLSRRPTTVSSAVIALSATSVILWVAALLIWRGGRGRLPLAFVCLLTSVVVVVDQLMGAPWSFTNFFGFSPLLAARFYGMGNEAAAILFGSTVTGMALLFDEAPQSKFTSWGKRIGIPLMALMTVSAAAAPWLGANVGFAVWGVVGFGLAWIVMNGHHVSFKAAFWLFVGVVVVIAAFATIDLYGGQQTHLARAIGSAEKGGAGELWTIVVRKAETNARVLTRTNWAYILLATLAFLGFERYRPHGDFADTLVGNPHFADAITVTLVAGIVAYFTEDSGVVIPALAVFYIGVALSWLMLSRLMDGASPPEPAESVSDR